MNSIDQIRINFDPNQLLLINICLGFLMFSVALDLSIKDFRRVFQQPKTMLVGLSAQLLLLPIFTILLIKLWNPPASVALGLGLIAACPGGNISNYTVHLAKGNTALSVCLTTIVTLSAVVTTPMIFAIIIKLSPEANALMSSISLSYFDLGKTILLLMIIPLSLGMLLNHYLPSYIKHVRSYISKAALLVFVSFIAAAIFSNIDVIKHQLHHVLSIVVLHNIGAMMIGYLYSGIFGLHPEDRKSITIETGIQNSGLGLVIIFNFFTQLGGMMLVAAWWGIWDMISALFLGLWWKYKSPRTSVQLT